MRPGERIADRFLIQYLVGTGGMGRVFRGLDLVTRLPVALKVVSEGADLDLEARLDREARVLASLEHEHVVRHVGHGRTPEGAFFLAMEWLVGEDLGQRLARGPLTMVEAIDVARRAASGLTAAHARGIVHRDVKPSNLFLIDGKVQRLKVLDFGLAGGPEFTRLTASGGWMGTPGYMAPEHARGEAIGPSADVFALGGVLFECLTGRPLFEGANSMAKMAKLLRHTPPRLRTYLPFAPAALEELLLRMLAADPEGRPADAGSLLAEIDAIAASVERARPSSPPPLSARERRLVSVLVIGNPDEASGADTLHGPQQLAAQLVPRVADVVARHKGRCTPMADGTLAVTLWTAGEAVDQAAAAARLATELQEIASRPVALAMGPGSTDDLPFSSESLERAVSLLRPGDLCIVLDDTTAGLLDGRFETEREDGRWLLVGREAALDTSRRLLGRPTPCLGREREIAMLISTYEQVAQERMAIATVVTAPAGAGKSRIRQEFARRLQGRGHAPLTLVCRGDPLSTCSPLGFVAAMVRAEAGIGPQHARETARDRLRARVHKAMDGEAASVTAAFLGELVGVPFDEREVPGLADARADPATMGERMRAAVEDWLTAESETASIVLIAEDLHWADGASVRFIDALLAHLAERPFFVLALGRPEVHELHPRLWHRRVTQQVALGPLPRRACEQLARMLLEGHAPPMLLSELVERSGGNAFFLEELIRAAASGSDALPETLAATMHRRLEQLDARSRQVLRVASVFGGEFRRSGVRALLGPHVNDSELGQTISTLVEQELLNDSAEPRTASRAPSLPPDPALTFRHALVREAAYASFEEDDRRTAHQLAATWLVETGVMDPALIADHFERADEASRAIPYWIQAARFALEAQDYELTIRSAERGIVAGALEEERSRLRRLQAEAAGWAYRWEEATRFVREAMELSQEGSETWFRAAGDLGCALGVAGDVDAYYETLGTIERAMHAKGRPFPEESAVGVLIFLYGHFCFGPQRRRPQLLRVLDHLTESEACRRPRVRGLLARLRSYLAFYEGRFDVAMRLCSEAERAFEAAGDLRNREGDRLNYVGQALLLGLDDEVRRACTVLANSRDPAIRGAASGCIGILAMREGHYQQALALFEESTRSFGKNEFPHRHRAVILCKLGGDLAQALQSAEAALRYTEMTSEAQCLATLAHVRRHRGELDEALSLAERALRFAMEIGQDEGTGFLRLELARCLLALHRTGDALACAEAGVAELRAMQHKVEASGLSGELVLRIPHHRELLELLRDLTGEGPTA